MNILMLLFKDVLYDARVKREAISLAQAGYQVTIACLKEYEEDITKLHKNITIERLNLSTKRVKRSLVMNENIKGNRNSSIIRQIILKMIRQPVVKLVKDYLSYFEHYKKIVKLIKGRKYDVIHCHDLNTLLQGVVLSKSFKLKLVYDSHEIFNEMAGRNNLDKKVGYWLEKRLFSKIDHFITVNEFVEKYLVEKYNKQPNTTIIQNIPLLINTEDTPVSQNYWRDQYNLSEEDVILLYQGGIAPFRGIEDCILALKELADHYKLVILGNGRIKENLVNLVKYQSMESRVFFHDQVPSDELNWYTKQADIGLVMYKSISLNNFYSTPNKIFEYIQAQIPCVSSDHPGKAYVVKKDITGICVKEDPKSIAAGVVEIVENYREYKENCRLATQKYTWENESRKLRELYQSI